MDTKIRTSGRGSEQTTVNSLRQSLLVLPEPAEKLDQALSQSIFRETMALVHSLGREIARDTGQATLEAHCAYEATRVVTEVLKSTTQALICNNDFIERSTAEHPELAANFAAMSEPVFSVMEQLPRLAMVSFLRRHHKVDTNGNY